MRYNLKENKLKLIIYLYKQKRIFGFQTISHYFLFASPPPIWKNKRRNCVATFTEKSLKITHTIICWKLIQIFKLWELWHPRIHENNRCWERDVKYTQLDFNINRWSFFHLFLLLLDLFPDIQHENIQQISKFSLIK